jgi:hypothetical protein
MADARERGFPCAVAADQRMNFPALQGEAENHQYRAL